MDITLPNSIVEFVKTETLDKGRVRTSVFLFLLDADLFDSMAAAIIRGELSVIECRIGTTIKHPKDKYDKKIAKEQAAKNLKKSRLTVINMVTNPRYGTVINLSYQFKLITVKKTKHNKILVKMG